MKKITWNFLQRQRSSNETSEKTEQSIVPQTPDTLIIWYHQADDAILQQLHPHLEVLRLRTGLRLHYFRYPTLIPEGPQGSEGPALLRALEIEQEKYIDSYRKTVQLMARGAAFIPCTSPTFMRLFWLDAKKDSHLKEYLSKGELPILPVPMQPMVDAMRSVLIDEPLAAYTGYERQVACTQIAARLEKILYRHYPYLERDRTLHSNPEAAQAARSILNPPRMSFFSRY